MQQVKDITFDADSADRCPHANAARQAAALAEKEASKARTATAQSATSPSAGTFNYQSFYEVELEKKHADK